MFGNLSERRKHYKFKRNITAALCALFILSIPAYAAFVACVLGFDLNPSLIVISLILPLALFVALAFSLGHVRLYTLPSRKPRAPRPARFSDQQNCLGYERSRFTCKTFFTAQRALHGDSTEIF